MTSDTQEQPNLSFAKYVTWFLGIPIVGMVATTVLAYELAASPWAVMLTVFAGFSVFLGLPYLFRIMEAPWLYAWMQDKQATADTPEG